MKNSEEKARVSLIIPCFNEEKRLSEEHILECLKLLGKNAEIVLVDDGSKDRTAGLLKKIASKSNAIRVISLGRNMGKAEAVRAGMRDALERGSEFAGFCDADFATPPAEVARVFKTLEKNGEANAAIGTRNSRQSANISRSAMRGFLSRVFSLISSFVLARRILDSQCGVKFFRTTSALKKALDEPFISRWGFDVEIIGRLEAGDATRTVEVPLQRWSEKSGSRISPLSMTTTLFDMRDINGDLKERRSRAGNRSGFLTEALLTVFVRMIPIYVLIYILAKILFWERYWVNPDAYYHMGVALSYMENGWLSDFPWLKYTVLGENFPNVYLMQHLLLGIIGKMIPSSDPTVILKTSVMVMAFLQAASFYFFLRKWKVSNAAIWTVLGITVSSNMLWHTIALKGITLFSIIFPWIVDALWSDNRRRAFFVGLLSAYTYVGFIIMLPLAACRFAGHLIFDGKFKIKTPLLLFAGVALGMVVTPFFPDNLSHIFRELKTVFERPDFIKAGDFFGSEWQIPNRLQLQHFLGGMLLSTIAASVFYMRGQNRANNVTGAAFIAVFVFALMPFFGGMKFAQTFVVLATTMVPIIFLPISRAGFTIPKMKIKIRPFVPVVFAFIFLVYSLPFIKGRQIKADPRAPVPAAYQKMGKVIRALTEKGKVVIAPWDDFPGLFYFNRDNHYVSGMNNLFLYHNDPQRFAAYYKFFKGGMKNPAKSIPFAFDGADLIIVRNDPRVEGEVKMLEEIKKAPGIVPIMEKDRKLFKGEGVVADYWRVYKILPEPENKQPPQKTPETGGEPESAE